MGSRSDLPVAENTVEVLEAFELRCEVDITSAHRAPVATRGYVSNAEARRCPAFIAAEGLAAHLAAQILPFADEELAGRVRAERKANADAVKPADAELQKSL
jgi:5-(carboxyamino)imidazole ribonucleotide mutase